MQKRTVNEFNGRKAGQKLKKTPLGSVLPYGEEEKIADFNSQTINALVTKDDKFQALVSQTIDEKQPEIQEGLKIIMSEYEGLEIEDFDKEDIDKIEAKYSKLINELVFSNPDVKKRFSTYEELLSDAHRSDYDDYMADKTLVGFMSNQPLPLAKALASTYKNMPTFVKGPYKTIHGIGTAIKAGSLGTKDYLKVQEQNFVNIKRAEEEGWDENTEGYFNNKGAFVVQKKGSYHPSTFGFTEKGTWGEAQKRAKKS